MDRDNYIDRLDVHLKMPLTHPLPTVQEADALVDEEVVPAVESVLEEMGREWDENIPLVEIDVGRVRRQDLRNAIESALRNALDRFAFSGNAAFPSPLEELLEYARSGKVPLERADAPFHPSLFVARVLTEDADAVRERIGAFSVKELAGLLLAIHPAGFPEEEASPAVRLRKEILARLTRDYPKTASILLARLSSWRHFRSLAGPQPVFRRDIVDVAGDGERPSAEAQSHSRKEEPGLKEPGETRLEEREGVFPQGYEEIGPQDIPAGVSVAVAGPALASGRETPDYVMTPDTPARYFRKVSMGSTTYPEGAVPVQDVVPRSLSGPLPESRRDFDGAVGDGEHPSPEVRSLAGKGETARKESEETRPEWIEGAFLREYEEIGFQDIPAGASVAVAGPGLASGPETPDYVMTWETPARYFRKASLGTSSYPEGPAPVQDTDEGIDSRSLSGPPPVSRRDIDGAVGDGDHPSPEVQSLAGKGETARKESEETRPEWIEGAFLRGYEEIGPQDIPAGVSVVVAGPALASGPETPDYVMTPETPARYFRKVSRRDIADVAGGVERLSPDVPSQAGKGKAGLRDSGEPRTEGMEGAFPEGYEEIGPQDIPAGASAVVAGPALASGQETPDYVMTPETPAKHYRKLAAGGEPRPGTEEGIWEVQDFEGVREDGRIPVSDAGLVLVHPFIHRFLENLGLVKKGEFVSELARIRAVHLLRDLTGSDEPHYPHNLLLEKILCGLPPGYAIPPEWEPDDAEKEEEEGLLKAVCEYWRPLSGSSVAALCEGFIHRRGSIERFEDSWTVRVEGKTIDILLDDLPWELSLIHLPWLEKPMAVEWQRERYD